MGTPLPRKPRFRGPSIPRPDAMRAHWANLNGRWQFRFDAQEQGLAEGWEKPGAAGLQPDDRRAFSVGERAFGNSPDQGCAQGGLVSPSVQSAHGFSSRERRLASLRGSRLAGRRLVERPEGRPSTKGVTRRSRPISRKSSIVRATMSWLFGRYDPTDPSVADRQASRLVHAELGHLADRLARSPAQDVHLRLPDRDSNRAGRGSGEGLDRRASIARSIARISSRMIQPSKAVSSTVEAARGKTDRQGRLRRSSSRRQCQDAKLWTPETPDAVRRDSRAQGCRGQGHGHRQDLLRAAHDQSRPIWRRAVRANSPERQTDLPAGGTRPVVQSQGALHGPRRRLS